MQPLDEPLVPETQVADEPDVADDVATADEARLADAPSAGDDARTESSPRPRPSPVRPGRDAARAERARRRPPSAEDAPRRAEPPTSAMPRPTRRPPTRPTATRARGRRGPPGAGGPTTVAELVAATLRAAGVRIAFTVAGESFLPVLDALQAAGIRIVATRHEGAAAFAAEAYGQLTGRPAACLGTRAVGAANLAIGIHTATADSTPMFVLVGQVDRGLRGREAFQEVDLVDTIGGLAKWAGEIDDRRPAAATLEAAVRATVEGRPGPALIAHPRGRPRPRAAGGHPRPGRPAAPRGAGRAATCAPSCTSSPRPSGR